MPYKDPQKRREHHCRYMRNYRVIKSRFCLDCSVDISRRGNGAKRCIGCSIEHKKRVRRKVRNCIDCKENISSSGSRAKRCYACSIEYRKVYKKKYNQSQKAREAHSRWHKSPEGKTQIAKWKKSPNGKLCLTRYSRSEGRKVSSKKYSQSDKGKETLRKSRESGRARIYDAKCRHRRQNNYGFNMLNVYSPSFHGHHVNDFDVVFIPAEIHLRYNGGTNKELHRKKILEYYGSLENMILNKRLADEHKQLNATLSMSPLMRA